MRGTLTMDWIPSLCSAWNSGGGWGIALRSATTWTVPRRNASPGAKSSTDILVLEFCQLRFGWFEHPALVKSRGSSYRATVQLVHITAHAQQWKYLDNNPYHPEPSLNLALWQGSTQISLHCCVALLQFPWIFFCASASCSISGVISSFCSVSVVFFAHSTFALGQRLDLIESWYWST